MTAYEMTRTAWLRNQERFREAARGEWHWPLYDPSAYDTTAELSPAETGELEGLICLFEEGRSREAYHLVAEAAGTDGTLSRIIQPLCNALDMVGAFKVRRHMALRALLQEVWQRRSLYWSWTSASWFEIYCANSEAFKHRQHVSRACRPYIRGIWYLLSEDVEGFPLKPTEAWDLACTIFGKACVSQAVDKARSGLETLGHTPSPSFPHLICQILLANHTPYLEALTLDMLTSLYDHGVAARHRPELVRLSGLLAKQAVIPGPLLPPGQTRAVFSPKMPGDIPPEWFEWSIRWHNASSLAASTRKNYFRYLMKVGIWLGLEHPEAGNPNHWTASLTREFVLAVNTLRVGQWTSKKADPRWKDRKGTPIAWRTRSRYFLVIQVFFTDCRRWGWLSGDVEAEQSFSG